MIDKDSRAGLDISFKHFQLQQAQNQIRDATSTFVDTSAEPDNSNGSIRHVKLSKRIAKNPRQPPSAEDKTDSSDDDEGGIKKTEKKGKKQQGDKRPKIEPKQVTPPPHDIFSYKKHSMDYFTVSGVILRTGYKDKKYWYILVIKELLDNAVDFFWKYYKSYKDNSVNVYLTNNEYILHIKVRN